MDNGVPMTDPQPDRDFWLEIRRGFLLIVSAIDRRYQVGRHEPEEKSLARASPYLRTEHKDP